MGCRPELVHFYIQIKPFKPAGNKSSSSSTTYSGQLGVGHGNISSSSVLEKHIHEAIHEVFSGPLEENLYKRHSIMKLPSMPDICGYGAHRGPCLKCLLVCWRR
ncbi:hypothetical protein ILYODFUR_027219 [Ilyodon furcidens]|uniref:Uncharacterized protein n=1 Tax=Ilyodon furcidens TaxID=33524 RepID=A0ABV0UBK4_9TELE